MVRHRTGVASVEIVEVLVDLLLRAVIRALAPDCMEEASNALRE
jgi:hypothetical protein